VLHERNPHDHPTAPFRSPPALVATGPYGTAPTLITGKADGSRCLAESTAIATYLIRTFDKEDKFGIQHGDWIRDEVLISMALTSLGRMTSMALFMDFMIIKNGDGPLGGAADGPMLKNVLQQLQTELENGPPGGFFMGKEPGRADVILEFPISSVKHRSWWVNLEKEFPILDAWLQRVYDRPAFKRSLQKGNGYDLATFPNGRAKHTL
jgi:glutathione S-transferase